MIKSQALEINLASYHVEVEIDAKYSILPEVMSKYYGLMEGLNTFLKELSHPYKNWQYIVIEARGYSLDYFHLLKNHPKGHDAADLFVNIFSEAIELSNDMGIKAEAADNMLLFLQKIIKDSGSDLKKFAPMLNSSFNLIRNYEDEHFFLFVKSFYQVKRLAEILLNHTDEFSTGFKAINLLLLKYFQFTYSYWLSEKNPQAWFDKEMEDAGDLGKIFEFFKDISHEQIRKWNNGLANINKLKKIGAENVLRKLVKLPGYKQFVEIYREIPQRLFDARGEEDKGNE